MRMSHLVNSETSDYNLLLFLDPYGTKHTTARIDHENVGHYHYYKLIPTPSRVLGFALNYEGTRTYENKTVPELKVNVQKLEELIFQITAEESGKQKHVLTVLLQESADELTGSIRPDIPDYFKQQMIAALTRNLDPTKNYLISEYIIQNFPGRNFYVRTEAVKLKSPILVNIIERSK